MILYSATVIVDQDIEQDWLNWLEQKHVPDVMNTGFFLEAKIFKYPAGENNPGKSSFLAQYLCKSEKDFLDYQQNYAPPLRAELIEKYGDKVEALRSTIRPELIYENKRLMTSDQITEQLVGTWRLLSCVYLADGRETDFMGSAPRGFLIYDKKGNMSAQFEAADRQRFASDDLRAALAEETKVAFDSYQAYFGTYEVEPGEAGSGKFRVLHHVKGAIFPNWTGRTEVRHVELQQDRLTIYSDPILSKGKEVVFKLEWERA